MEDIENSNHDQNISQETTDWYIASNNDTTVPSNSYGSSNDWVAVELILAPVRMAIVAIGIIGNVLSLIVFSRQKEISSSIIYFIVISSADIILLCNGIFVFLLKSGRGQLVVLTAGTEWLCSFSFVLQHVCPLISVWALCSLSFDRFIAVVYPLKKTMICTKRKAALSMTVVLIIAFGYQIHNFWSRGVVKGLCTSLVNMRSFLRMDSWIKLATYSFLPSIIILVCNIGIVRKTIIVRNNKLPIHGNQNFRFIPLLIAVSILFIVCTALYSAFSILFQLTYNTLYILIAPAFLYLNHAGNFYLYILTGSRFRADFKTIFCFCLKNNSTVSESQDVETTTCDFIGIKERLCYCRRNSLNIFDDSATGKRNQLNSLRVPFDNFDKDVGIDNVVFQPLPIQKPFTHIIVGRRHSS